MRLMVVLGVIVMIVLVVVVMAVFMVMVEWLWLTISKPGMCKIYNLPGIYELYKTCMHA